MDFSRDPSPMRLFIATDAGYQPTVRAVKSAPLDAQSPWPTLVLFGAEDVLPFRPRPSTILVPGMPAGVIACIPSLEEFGIASRLASTAGLPGCHDGTVVDLATLWLQSIESPLLKQVRIIVSGASETIGAVEELGRRFMLPVAVIELDSAA